MMTTSTRVEDAKPDKRAFAVTEHDENTGLVYFARHDIEARRLGANEFAEGELSMSSEVDLLPCPLCSVHLFHNGASELGDIYEHPNNGCAMQVAWFTATPEWVEKWNRRSTSPSIGRVGALTLEGFAAKLSAAMETRQARVRALAEEIGVDKSAISRARRGKAVSQDNFISLWNWLHALVSHEEPAGDTQGALPAAWRWRAKVKGEWSLWSVAEVDPNDWLWREYWEELEVAPLYLHPAALVSPHDNGEVVEALIEACNQIEYLHGKFQETGSGNAVIAKLTDLRRKLQSAPPALQSHNEGSE